MFVLETDECFPVKAGQTLLLTVWKQRFYFQRMELNFMELHHTANLHLQPIFGSQNMFFCVFTHWSAPFWSMFDVARCRKRALV